VPAIPVAIAAATTVPPRAQAAAKIVNHKIANQMSAAPIAL
jgi:hypothetical protein